MAEKESVKAIRNKLLVMQREIKFRGFSKKLNKWVYGYYYSECGIHYIIENRQQESELNRNTPCEILLESVGQYIGLKDKNGKEICEGDVDSNYGVIKYSNIDSAFKIIFRGNEFYLGAYHNTEPIKIIGNIFENPNLVRVA